ncbi:TetR/AcrR family transcriptional regulator [Thalassobacillus sp. C254]|uniref:TetR/AcrR family transcriptional regulator n=1 Tax=Thalassobacillus sp. C254 TaxID=1225341 RepID=UPI0006D056BC|nr:TetR/AcrR family transcriptional regulator [Thalassobacillus sp. C254]
MSTKDTPKCKILNTAARLFREQGYHATGLNQIIKESGAPKGSLYHYFPNGKEELAVEAVRITKDKASAAVKETLHSHPDAAVAIQAFFIGFKEYIMNRKENEEEPLPIGLLALETSQMSEPLRVICQQTYEEWQEIFKMKLISAGMEHKDAADKSLLIIMMLEGAVTLSAAKDSSLPFEVIAEQIPSLLHNVDSI